MKTITKLTEEIAKLQAKSGKMTPARAGAIRRLKMERCGCWLCAGALNPNPTAEEYEARRVETFRRNLTGSFDSCGAREAYAQLHGCCPVCNTHDGHGTYERFGNREACYLKSANNAVKKAA